jgi:hypothetical protein
MWYADLRVVDYHRLSVSDKLAYAAEQQREPSVACPADCGVQVQPLDLLGHLEQRCPGPREPGPGAIWVDRQTAVAAGVPPPTLTYWARTGKVRTRGSKMDRKYLLRDLARRVVIRRLDRRR